MLDRMNPKALILLLVVFAAIVAALLIGGCKGPDVMHRTLATFEISYTDGSGTIDGTHNGVLDNPGYAPDSSYSGGGSSDADWHAWTFSISPLAGLYDPSARTSEAIERQYQLMLAREDRERVERAALLPFIEKAPEPVANASSPASGDGAAGSAAISDLPWWKDTALLIGYATVVGAVIAGLVQGWKRVKPAKE